MSTVDIFLDNQQIYDIIIRYSTYGGIVQRLEREALTL